MTPTGTGSRATAVRKERLREFWEAVPLWELIGLVVFVLAWVSILDRLDRLSQEIHRVHQEVVDRPISGE